MVNECVLQNGVWMDEFVKAREGCVLCQIRLSRGTWIPRRFCDNSLGIFISNPSRHFSLNSLRGVSTAVDLPE